jgi:hypothetical protein
MKQGLIAYIIRMNQNNPHFKFFETFVFHLNTAVGCRVIDQGLLQIDAWAGFDEILDLTALKGDLSIYSCGPTSCLLGQYL